MRTLILISTLLFLLLSPLAIGDEVKIAQYTPYAYGKITVTTAAVIQLDATNRVNSGAIFATIEDNDIRFRIDGGNPAITDGHLVSSIDLQSIWLVDPMSIRNLRMISLVGNATVYVTYYRKIQ